MATSKTFRQRIQRRAGAELRNIENASNMLEVENALSNAMHKVFGSWNIGLKKCAAIRKGSFDPIAWENNRQRRAEAQYRFGEHARNIILSYVPARLRGTIMYSKLITR